jgi:hypothetical protein
MVDPSRLRGIRQGLNRRRQQILPKLPSVPFLTVCSASARTDPRSKGTQQRSGKSSPTSSGSPRRDSHFDSLNAELRSKGVNTQKPLHPLRKEHSSLINKAHGIHARQQGSEARRYLCYEQFLHRFQDACNAGTGKVVYVKETDQIVSAPGDDFRCRREGDKRCRQQDRSICLRITGLQVRALRGASPSAFSSCSRAFAASLAASPLGYTKFFFPVNKP